MSLHPRAPAPPVTRRVTALLRCCHPEPALAVTALVTALAVAAGRGAAGSAAVGAAVLAGQLSIGWSNDALDARRDAEAGRADKPLATGEVPVRAVVVAAGVSLAACVPLSLLSGVPAAAAHLLGVVVALGYNLWFKRTMLSPLTYAWAFGSLPVFVTLGLPSRPWPAWWAVIAAALLGVGAHLVNVLPDIADDLAGGVRGLPQRLGGAACRWLAPLVLLTAMGVLAIGPAGPAGLVEWALTALAGVVVVGGLVGDPHGRGPFRAAMVVAALAVVLLLLHGSDIS